MKKVTLIPGDGIGPEVTGSVMKIIDSSGAKIDWEVHDIDLSLLKPGTDKIPGTVIDSIRKNKVALKGPVTTPVGEGYRSINVMLRKELDLYANIRPIKTYKGIPTLYDNVDILIVRENTEDLYVGIEHMVGDEAAESIKIFTKKGCRRIVRYAFEYAVKEGRKKVTAVHKANIMKLTDGMFLNIAREISKEYPDIIFEEMIVDAMSMKLVQKPQIYDVLVLPNLYGDILSDLCAGLVGGLGFAPGANIGECCAVFEAVHGSAPDIAGMNIANPTAIILSGIHMLKYINEDIAAERIENALKRVLAEGRVLTGDIGGTASTFEFTDHIISTIRKHL